MGKTCTCNQEKTKIIGKQALPLLALLTTKLRTNGSHPVNYIDTWLRYPNEECMHVQSTTSCPFQGCSFYTTLSALFILFLSWAGGGNQLPPISLLLPLAATCGLLSYFPNWPPLRLRWAHYFRMRDHGSSLFSAVKNLHFSGLCRLSKWCLVFSFTGGQVYVKLDLIRHISHTVAESCTTPMR